MNGRRAVRRGLSGIGGALAVVALIATPAGAVTVQHSYEIYGTDSISTVSCPTTSVEGCVSVGVENEGGEADFVSISDLYPFEGSLYGIACPNASGCLAVGEVPLGPEIITVKPSGQPTGSRFVGSQTLLAIGCTPVATRQHCVAAGFGGDVVAVSSAGVPGPVTSVGSDVFSAVACPTAATCLAVGRDTSTGEGVAVTVRGNRAGAPHDIAGTTSLAGVSCPSPTACLAVGQAASGAVVVPVSPAGVGGTPAALPVATVHAITCIGGGCDAVGESGSEGVIVPITSTGAPGTAVDVAGASQLLGVGCSSATSCIANGVARDADGGDTTRFTN